MKKNARQAVHNYCAIKYLLSNHVATTKEVCNAYPELNKKTAKRHVASFVSNEIPYYDLSKKYQKKCEELFEYQINEESFAYKICREILAILGLVSVIVYAYKFFI